MKIRELRFSNLNSLAGEWKIRFTDTVYSSSGLFAITGPTGSGKTTILDAISLALYGRTPRLGKITKSGNEIMSRHTGECMAEVEFESQKGVYRCHWSQQRARKRSGGKLQEPRHEISDAVTGEILASKKADVLDVIEYATGMSFEQFTRTILLAQGGFAAFLQARPSDRAPILEQITGTEIYSRISIRVHERYGKEKSELELLERECAGITLLTPDAVEELEAQVARFKSELTGLDSEITRAREVLSRSERVARLEQEREKTTAMLREVEVSVAIFEPDLQRLRSARRAVELDGLYHRLCADREYIATTTHAYEEASRKLSGLTCQLPRVEEEMRLALGRKEAAEKAFEDNIPVFRHVRELDARLADITTQQLTCKAEIQRICEESEVLRSTTGRLAKDLEVMASELARSTGYCRENAIDAGLREEYSGLEVQVQAMRDLISRQEKNTSSLLEAQEGLVQAGEAFRLAREEAGHQEEVMKAAWEELERSRAVMKELVGEQDLTLLNKEKDDLTTRKARLGELFHITEEMRLLGERKELLEGEERELTGRLTALAREMEDISASVDLQEKACRALQEKVLLLSRVRDLEEERLHLRDGLPCPLCGSTDHPYASGNVPDLTAAEEEMESAASDLQALQSRAEEKRSESVRTETFHQKTCEELLALETRLLQLEGLWEGGARELGLDPHDPDPGAETGKAIATAEATLSAMKEILLRAEEIEREIRAAEQRERAEGEAFHAVGMRMKEVGLTCDRLRETLLELMRESEGLAADTSTLLEVLSTKFGRYGLAVSSLPRVEELDDFLAVLGERKDLYIAEEKKAREEKERCDAIREELREWERRLEESGKLAARMGEELTELSRKYDEVRSERYSLFGEKDPAVEEERLTRDLRRVRDEAADLRNSHTALMAAIESQDGIIVDLERSLKEIGAKVSVTESEFLEACRHAGFRDEEEFRQAHMATEEREALEEEERRLMETRAALDHRLRGFQDELDAEQGEALAEIPPGELRSTIDALQEKWNEVQRELWGLEERLREQVQQNAVLAGVMARRDAQKEVVARLHRLHELIGSADGNTFRSFAQGLTFRHLINLANRHLTRMTDRYLLLQDDNDPLELAVVDIWQAGVTRSTRNLSGGEAFIVSLALALGLSGMASKNVRVDSLFLDEGFGALDAEALEMALDTLVSLREEGKLIGVISHVQALKDRIPTRIEVIKGTGGRSRLVLPRA